MFAVDDLELEAHGRALLQEAFDATIVRVTKDDGREPLIEGRLGTGSDRGQDVAVHAAVMNAHQRPGGNQGLIDDEMR